MLGKTQHLAFLNFCRVDVAAARRLYEDLTKAGIPVWFDETSLLPGQQWQHVIMSAIPDSSTVLVLHSSRSVGRPGYVNAELLAALEELDKYPPDDIFVIPIRIDECDLRHPRLNSINRVDMFPDWDTGLGQLLESIYSVTNRVADSKLDNLELQIRNPQPGEHVRHTVSADGIISTNTNLAGLELWLMTEPVEHGYHPSTPPIVVENDCWRGTAYVGNSAHDADQGKPFLIHVFATSLDTGRHIRAYLGKAREEGWRGMSYLRHARKLATVQVIREN